MSNYGKTGGTVDINKRPQIDWKFLAEKAEALNGRWNIEAGKFFAGSEYVDDPKRVFARVQQLRDSHGEAMKGRVKAEAEKEQLQARLQRATDLVRYQRHELHTASLITDEEFAELVQVEGAVGRLEGYDASVKRIAQLQARVEELSKLVLYWKDRCDLDEKRIATLEEKLKQAVEALKPFADCEERWMSGRGKSEIRFDWLTRAREVRAAIEAVNKEGK